MSGSAARESQTQRVLIKPGRASIGYGARSPVW